MKTVLTGVTLAAGLLFNMTSQAASIITFDYSFSVESFSSSPDFDLITNSLRAADAANNNDGFITGTISIDDTPGASPLHISEMDGVSSINPYPIIDIDVLTPKLNSVKWDFDWSLIIGSRLSTRWTLTMTSDSVVADCLQYVLVTDALTCNDLIYSGLGVPGATDFRYGESEMTASASVTLKQSQSVSEVPIPASIFLFGLTAPLLISVRRRMTLQKG